MKRTFNAILTGSILCALTILTAEVKQKKGDDFLRINDNIQNEELRSELKILREEFNIERNRIRQDYNDKIEALKEARRNEMKTIKADFAGRREVLMKKYVGTMRKKPKMQFIEPVKNKPGKMKTSKDKKKLRKN